MDSEHTACIRKHGNLKGVRNSAHHRDRIDYHARVVRLRRWYPNRAPGESTGNTGDSRGDESLYRPTALGSAASSLSRVPAGENRPFELIYRPGTFVLKKGAVVKFWMAGQGSLGTTPQTGNPVEPGFVEAQAKRVGIQTLCDKARVISLEHGENPKEGAEPGDIIVGPVCVGFRVTRGKLVKGQTVRLKVGRTGGFTWTCLAGRKEFKVIIEPGRGAARMRLPEPVVIEVLPREPDHVDVFLPPSHASGDVLRATIAVRDRFDNRVSCDGPATIHVSGSARTAYLSGGLGYADIRTARTQPVRVEVKCRWVRGRSESNWSIAADDLRLFIGDLHAHDFNSTAESYPADVYRWARDEKRLDFVSVPLQMHRYIDNEKWLLAKHMNEYFLEEGRFVTFLAFEWQHSHYGDKVVHYLGGDLPYLAVDDPRYRHARALYKALRHADAFIVSHHPAYALDLHVPGTDWESLETDVDRLVEIWSMHGSSEGYDPKDRPLVPPWRPAGARDGLRRGLRFGLVAGSDTHRGRPGGSVQEPRPYRGGLCAVWARSLTRRDLFEAFLARRTYALTGARIALQFTVNGSSMGSETPVSRKRSLFAEIRAPRPVQYVQFMRNTDLLYEEHPGERCCRVRFEDKVGVAPAFYHCRVMQDDGHLAVCSPVWVGDARSVRTRRPQPGRTMD